MRALSVAVLVVAACQTEPTPENQPELSVETLLDLGEIDLATTQDLPPPPDMSQSDFSGWLANGCPKSFMAAAQGGSTMDVGFVGYGHGIELLPGSAVSANITCSADCSVCTFSGPIPNNEVDPVRASNRRCFDDTSKACLSNNDCPGSRCTFFFGSPIPLYVAGIPTCVLNELSGGLSGSGNLQTGTVVVDKIKTMVHPSLKTCPICNPNTLKCEGGSTRDGLACVPGETSLRTGKPTSLDCPYVPTGYPPLILDFPPLQNQTDVTWTVDNNSPACGDGPNLKCLCGSCPVATPQACRNNAGCPGNLQCNGKRCNNGANAGDACTMTAQCTGGICGVPGKPTRPNTCTDGECGAPGNNRFPGDCTAGPLTSVCNQTEAPCASSMDCVNNNGTYCVGRTRSCYPELAVGDTTAKLTAKSSGGSFPGTVVLGTPLCTAHTQNNTIDDNLGLPGPSRLQLRLSMYYGPNNIVPGLDGGANDSGTDGGSLDGGALNDLSVASGPKYIFVTGDSFTGALGAGGAAGADTLCQAAADARTPLKLRTWTAYIADATHTALDRLTVSSGPWYLVGAPPDAGSAITYADLNSAALPFKVNVDESGAQIPAGEKVWTGVKDDGTAATDYCNNWTSLSSQQKGQRGNSGQTDVRWRSDGASASCAGLSRLYCIEK